jgi:hypothetical protein
VRAWALRTAGFAGHRVNVERDNPNALHVYVAVTDLQKAREFAASDELRQRMIKAGVIGPPQLTWLTPVREEVDQERRLPAIMIRHQVADFDAWLNRYNQADEMRLERGIVGHAVNQLLDDPSTAFVYHQAESFDALERCFADDALRAAMQEAGVTSEPDVTFVTGGWSKRY